jgi:uncharacterized membrane protein YuzA (DUF378 family)
MKTIIMTFLASITLVLYAPLLVQPAFAACPAADKATTPNDQILVGTGATGNDCNDNGVDQILNTAVTILSLVVGAAAVIMIIVSGFKYITSGGDSGKVGSAKNTLIYAVIGLAVAALAQLLVHFVFTASTQAVNPPTCSKGQTPAKDNCKKP